MYKAPQLRSTFRSCDVEKVNDVVARSTFRSQNTPCSDHLWKLRCRKSARRCGAKHICLQVNMHKRHHFRTIFGSWDVEKVHAVVARSPFRSQKCKKLRGTEHFWTFRCRFASQSQGIVYLVKIEENLRGLCSSFNYNHHYTTLHYTTTTATTTTTTTLRYYITLLHYTTLH